MLVCAGLSLVSGRDAAAQAPAAFELGIVNVDGTKRVLGQLPLSTYAPRLSPDGRRMAYASNESGRYEVWLEPLPGTGMRYRITKDGGSHPLWRPDGRALYFDRDHQMFSVAVRLLTIVRPETLVRWRRDLYRLFWRVKSRQRGRPCIPIERTSHTRHSSRRFQRASWRPASSLPARTHRGLTFCGAQDRTPSSIRR